MDNNDLKEIDAKVISEVDDKEVVKIGLIYYPNPMLRKESAPISQITEGIVSLIKAMTEIMTHHGGIGIAAPQVGVPVRIIIIMQGKEPRAVINPEIIRKSKSKSNGLEGCLSVPNISGNVIRHDNIKITGLDIDGNKIEIEASDHAARELQHEIDHLNGLLFIDKLTPASKVSVRNKMKKMGYNVKWTN